MIIMLAKSMSGSQVIGILLISCIIFFIISCTALSYAFNAALSLLLAELMARPWEAGPDGSVLRDSFWQDAKRPKEIIAAKTALVVLLSGNIMFDLKCERKSCS
jgi:hypothetical protein